MAEHKWQISNIFSDVPDGAVLAGHDSDGSEIYIGRAFHDGDVLIAKIVPGRQEAYVSYQGEEIKKHDIEFLIGDKYSWVECSGGNVPTDAIECGKTSDGEILYIGRALWNDALTPGKVHPSHGCLYISYGGEEHSITEYEILVQPETWVPAFIDDIPFDAVLGGFDSDGADIYVGRAHYGGDLIPAKVIPARGKAYVAHAQHEHEVPEFEVLVGAGYGWVPAEGGYVPPKAVTAGETCDGEALFIGRAHHSGSLIPGKIHPSHGVVYIPYAGEEISESSYEVLVRF